jgi:FkbM family methyltransferase
MFSQNDEEKYILQYFENKSGMFLDIGAHDGKQLSNTRQLALNGWRGVCVEPSKIVFPYLESLYKDNVQIECVNKCVTDYNGTIRFYESNGDLIGSADPEHVEKCRRSGYPFKEILIACTDVKTLCDGIQFDFISIDAEGWDMKILKQFPNDFYGASMICIECSGNTRTEMLNYLQSKGFTKHHTTGENLIVIKNQ